MPVEPRNWLPTAPPASSVPATLITGQAAAHSSAAGVPALFEGLLAGLADFEAQVDQLPPPSRVATTALERLAGDGRLVLDLRGLPAEQVAPVAIGVTAGGGLVPGSVLAPFQWAAAEGDLTLRITPDEAINQLTVSTFGESRVRLLREDHDSGWLDCAWERLIPVPYSAAPLTLELTSHSRWSGLSRLSAEQVAYSRDALLTLGTLATGTRVEVEATHQGTTVLEYALGPDGPFESSPFVPAAEMTG